MGKLLSWEVLALLVYVAYRLVVVSKRRAERARAAAQTHRGDEAARPGQAVGERMVACAHCGVYLPATDALEADGHPYCSPAHRTAGPRAGA